MLSSKYSVKEDLHTQVSIFSKNYSNAKKLSLTPSKQINYNIFQKMSKLECNKRKTLKFHVVLKILIKRRLTHTYFYFFPKFLQNVKSDVLHLQNKSIIIFSKKCQIGSVTRAKYSIFTLSSKYFIIEY